tara:strand:+ start:225 stop:464 length:240 start_codon:yes stop_codon:yes gene_type:complete
MDFIQVADNFPAWDVKWADKEIVGLVTNFAGEGFACTIQADFTNDVERTIYEPNVASLDDMKGIINLFIINLIDAYVAS